MGMGNKDCLAKRVRGRPLAWSGLCHIPVRGGSSDLPNTATYQRADLLPDLKAASLAEAKVEGTEATISSKLVAFLLYIPFLSLFPHVGAKH